MKTKVVFRKWKDSGDIIALFPEIPATSNPAHCLSYEQVGQHGAACPQSVVADSKLATPEEYKKLAGELIRIGYELEPGIRATGNKFWRKRSAAIKAI